MIWAAAGCGGGGGSIAETPAVTPAVSTTAAAVQGTVFAPSGVGAPREVGRTLNALGRDVPMSGATVTVLVMDSSATLIPVAGLQTVSDAAGNFSLAAVPVGDNYIIEAGKILSSGEQVTVRQVFSVTSSDATAGSKSVTADAAGLLTQLALKETVLGFAASGDPVSASSISRDQVQLLSDAVAAALQQDAIQTVENQSVNLASAAMGNGSAALAALKAKSYGTTIGDRETSIRTKTNVRVTVTDATGARVQSAKVYFTIGGNTFSLITDSGGSALFADTIAQSAFHLETVKKGYLKQTSDGTSPKAGRTQDVTVTMTASSVNQAPTANAGAAQTSPIGVPVVLNGNGSFDPDENSLTYSWSQTSGPALGLSVQNSVTATFTPQVPGAYVFQLVVNDGLVNSAPSSVTVTVGANQAPTVAAAASPRYGVAPLTVSFIGGCSDTDGTCASYQWDFGDGTSRSSSQSPSHTFAVNGTYIATLTVTDNAGGSGQSTVSIFVGVSNPPPTANAGPDQTARVGSLTTLNGGGSTDPDGNALTYAWSQTSGPAAVLSSATAIQPTFTPAQAGVYVFQLIVNDGTSNSVADSVNITVVQNYPPLSQPSASPTSGAAPLAVNFTGGCSDSDGTCAAVYSWIFGDGATSTAQNPAHTFTRSGDYAVALTVTDNEGATNTETVLIHIVNQPPTAAPTASPNSGTAPLVVNFTSACADADGSCVTYLWNFGDGGPTTSTQNPSHTYTLAGTYTVSLTVTDNLGAATTATTSVTVTNTAPTPGATATPSSGNVPLVVQLNGTCVDPDGTCASYLWNFGDGSPMSSTQNPSHTFTTTGIFTVTLTVTDNSGAAAQTNLTVTVTGVVTLAGTGVAGLANGAGSSAQFSGPRGVARDAAGNIYVADCANHAVRMVTSSGVVSTLAGSGVDGFATGTCAAAQFSCPSDVVVDATGTVYMADRDNNTIFKITPSQCGTANGVAVLAGTNAAGYVTTTTCALARFNAPTSLVLDSTAANLYVTDRNNHSIRRIQTTCPAGAVTTLAGTNTAGYVDSTTCALARFNTPTGIAINNTTGILYVADTNNQRMRRISVAAGACNGAPNVLTVAGSGAAGFADGTGAAAIFNNPVGAGVDAAGNVYVADYSNHLIRMMTAAGVVTTFAGAGTAGYLDGASATARFNNPVGVTVDTSNNVYVGDFSNNRIRKIMP